MRIPKIKKIVLNMGLGDASRRLGAFELRLSGLQGGLGQQKRDLAALQTELIQKESAVDETTGSQAKNVEQRADVVDDHAAVRSDLLLQPRLLLLGHLQVLLERPGRGELAELLERHRHEVALGHALAHERAARSLP